MSYNARFRVWRGDDTDGELEDFSVEVKEGEVILDIIHRLQATQTPDLAVRWNCKAGKCGSCSAEVNGRPRLMCMTRMSTFTEDEVITVTPLRAFPVIKDLVTDVSFNYQKAREVPAFAPPADLAPGEYRMQQVDVERSQEFRKCIECFLCQDTCHVIRDHEENKESFAGPRFFIRLAELDMHPLDTKDRKREAQATQAGDLAVRWNCKAGKCGSCSAEVNGRPALMCMTRLSDFDESETITVTPMRAFPVIRDLVTDVSFNYEKARELPSFAPPPRDADGKRRMAQIDVERGQEFRKCIECFLCQDTCHVVRDHEDNKPAFAGPRFFLRYAELDMHPLDTHDRRSLAQGAAGIGMCNITKCCTEVCPEGIKITDNAIIPMKERVVDRKYDPLVWLGNKIGLRSKDDEGRAEV